MWWVIGLTTPAIIGLFIVLNQDRKTQPWTRQDDDED